MSGMYGAKERGTQDCSRKAFAQPTQLLPPATPNFLLQLEVGAKIFIYFFQPFPGIF